MKIKNVSPQQASQQLSDSAIFRTTATDLPPTAMYARENVYYLLSKGDNGKKGGLEVDVLNAEIDENDQAPKFRVAIGRKLFGSCNTWNNQSSFVAARRAVIPHFLASCNWVAFQMATEPPSLQRRASLLCERTKPGPATGGWHDIGSLPLSLSTCEALPSHGLMVCFSMKRNKSR